MSPHVAGLAVTMNDACMEDPDHLRSDEVYTIKQVAERTGVNANTIRSWERRFGFLSPPRTTGNYRVYTREDMAQIEGLRDARDRGVPLEQAIRIQHAPVSIRSSPMLPEAKPRHWPIDALLDALDEGNLQRARDIVSDSAVITSIDVTVFALLLPALDTLTVEALYGRRDAWKISLAQSWIRRNLDAMLHGSRPDDGYARVLMARLEEPASLDLLTAHAIVASRAGLQVTVLDTVMSLRAIQGAATQLRPALVCLGVSTPAAVVARASHLDAAVAMISEGEGSGAAYPIVPNDPVASIEVMRKLVGSTRSSPRLVAP